VDKTILELADAIELTVQAAVTKDPNGNIPWSVMGLGSSYKSGMTQTLKLTLTPVWKTTGRTLIRDFTIADAQPASESDDHTSGRLESPSR